MIACDKDYRMCGHCKAQFANKFMSSRPMLPRCDKLDIHSAHLITEWMCPNAPKPTELLKPEDKPCK